jgi:hypothetical protein
VRVICAYAGEIQPKTEEAIAKFAPETEYVEMHGLYGYGEAIASRWDGSSDLVIIEHDNEITVEVMPSFTSCDRLWCVYAYDIFPAPHTFVMDHGLGCTRFSAELQKVVSVEEFIRPDWDFLPKCRRCDGAGCWATLDSRIFIAMMTRGIEQHIHGKIPHHHGYTDVNEWLKSLQDDFEFRN